MLTDHLVIFEIYFESLEKEKIRDKGNRDFFTLPLKLIENI